MRPPTPTKTAAAIQRDGRISIRLMRLFARLELPDQVPVHDDGRPTLAAANHRSLLDVFCAAALCASANVSCRFLVQARYFDQPLIGRWLRRIGCIPLNNKTKQAAFDTAIESLRAGELVGIMPEGRLVPSEERDQVGRARPGVGELVAQTNAWIRPVVFHNTEVVWPRDGWPRPRLRRPTVTLELGPPIDVAALAAENPQAAADEIMAALAEELDRLDAIDRSRR